MPAGSGGTGAANGSPTGGVPSAAGSGGTGGAPATSGNAPMGGGGPSGSGGVAGMNGSGGTPGAGGSGAAAGVDSMGGVPGGGAGGDAAAGGTAGADGGAAGVAGAGTAGADGEAGGAAGAGTAGTGAGEGGTGGTAETPGEGGAGGSAGGGDAGSPSFRPCPTNGDPCKVLPLGDSITHGVQSRDNAGYRSHLFKLAVEADQKLTFVGSQSSGPDQVAGKPFPKNHEGRSGWTIDPGHSKYGSGGISSLIPNPALSASPNIILLMIGTNDITSTDNPGTTAERLDGLLEKLVQAAPESLIVVAQITPVSFDSADLRNYNAKIPGIVQARIEKGQHLLLVDMSKMPTSGLAPDGVHPNDQGYAYMANVWYEAIKEFLPN
ncbi:MAG: SGNH/GDSL hydrolase family protein [Pseudomonadota bacterium]